VNPRHKIFAPLASSLLLGACVTAPPGADQPPIVFVHGNGDSAAIWQSTLWRFESNGWPRERLHAIDLPFPLARDDDGKAQPGRTSSTEHMAYLKAEVEKVLKATGNYAKNLPLPGAQLAVYATDPATGERRGAAAHSKTVGSDGLWGPFTAQTGVPYKFVISAPGYATTHIYRSPFARSSELIHLRAERAAAADKDAKSIVILTRPRGYFDTERDTMAFEGKALPGVPPTGAGVSNSKVKLMEDGVRAISAAFNGKKFTGRTWPTTDNHLVVLELTY